MHGSYDTGGGGSGWELGSVGGEVYNCVDRWFVVRDTYSSQRPSTGLLGQVCMSTRPQSTLIL